MTSSATIGNLCSQALLRIGTRATITSLNEPSTEAIACKTFFSTVYESLARSASWNALKKQTSLSLLLSSPGTPTNPTGTLTPYPPTPWLYQYAEPADCLYVRRLVPSMPITGVQNPPIFPNGNFSWLNYQLAQNENPPFSVSYATDAVGNPENIILTNLPNAECVYTVNQPNPAIWDSLFQSAFISALAVWLVPALNANAALMQACKADAEAAIAQARIRDGDEGVTSMDHIPDWFRARTGQGPGLTYPSGPTGYINMVWPT